VGILDFVAGWALGAKAGNEGFDDVIETAKAIYGSKEFHDLVGALRAHVGYSLKELGDLVTGGSPEPAEDLLDMVRRLAQRRDTAFGPWLGRMRPPPAEEK
jgi:hypothetical protein